MYNIYQGAGKGMKPKDKGVGILVAVFFVSPYQIP